VLLEGLSLVLGITLGQASWIMNGVFLLFCFFYHRRQLNWGTVIFMVLYGFAIDFFQGVVPYPSGRLPCFIVMLLGLTVMAFGAATAAFADCGRGPCEAFTFALAEKNRWPIRRVRMIQDAALVLAGVALGGKAGLCTLCTIFLSGPIIQASVSLLRRLFPRFATQS